MATDDIQVLVVGATDAPAGFLIPGNGQIKPKAMNAVFDGTNAAGDFLPTLEIVSDAGIVVARCPAPSVAAGASAEVSWFPHVAEPAAASTGIAQIWKFGSIWNPSGTPQLIPSGVWTQVAFFNESGPAPPTVSPVTFDFSTGKVAFYGFSGIAQMRWVRASVVWSAATCLKRLGLRWSKIGTVAFNDADNITAAKYLPTVDLTTDETYEELITYVTPFIFTPPPDSMTATLWAYQDSGAGLNLDSAIFEVLLPFDGAGNPL